MTLFIEDVNRIQQNSLAVKDQNTRLMTVNDRLLSESEMLRQELYSLRGRVNEGDYITKTSVEIIDRSEEVLQIEIELKKYVMENGRLKLHFQELQDELRALRGENASLKDSARKNPSTNETDSYRIRIQELMRETTALRAELDPLRLRLSESEKTMKQQNQKLHSRTIELQKLSEELDRGKQSQDKEKFSLKTELETLRSRCVEYERTIKGYNEKLSLKQHELQRLNDEYLSFKLSHDRLLKEKAELLSKLDGSNQTKSLLVELDEQINQLNQKLTSLASVNRSLDEENRRLMVERKSFDEKVRESAKKSEDLTAHNRELVHTIDRLTMDSQKINRVSQEIVDLKKTVMDKDYEIEKHKLAILRFEKTNTDVVKKLKESNDDNEQLLDKISFLEESIARSKQLRASNKQDEIAKLQADLSDAENELIAVKSELRKTQSSLRDSKEEEEGMRRKIVQLDTLVAKLGAELEAARYSVDQASQRITQILSETTTKSELLRQHIITLESDLVNSNTRESRIEQANKDLISSLEKVRKSLEQAEAELLTVKFELTLCQNRLKQAEAEVKELSRNAESSSTETTWLKEKVRDQTSKISILESSEQRLTLLVKTVESQLLEAGERANNAHSGYLVKESENREIIQRLKEQLHSVTSELDRLRISIKQMESTTVATLTRKLHDAEDRIKTLEDERDKLRGDFSSLHENLTQNSRHHQTALDELNLRYAAIEDDGRKRENLLEARILQLLNELETAEGYFTALQRSKADCEKWRLENAELQERIAEASDSFTQHINQLTLRISVVENDRSTTTLNFEALIGQLRKDLEDSQLLSEQRVSEIQRLNQEKEHLMDQLKTREKEVRELRDDQTQRDSYDRLKVDNENLERRITLITESHETVVNELTVKIRMIEEEMRRRDSDYSLRISQLSSDESAVQELLRQHVFQLNALREEISRQDELVRSLQRENNKLQDEGLSQINAAQLSISDLEAQIKQLQSQNRSLVDQHLSELNHARQNINTLEMQIINMRQEIQSLKESNQGLSSQLTQNTEYHERIVSELTTKLITSDEHARRKEFELADSNEQNSRLNIIIQNLQEDKTLHEQIELLRQDNEELHQRLSESNEMHNVTVIQLNNRIATNEQEGRRRESELETKVAQLQFELDVALKDIRENDNELNLLKQHNERLKIESGNLTEEIRLLREDKTISDHSHTLTLQIQILQQSLTQTEQRAYNLAENLSEEKQNRGSLEVEVSRLRLALESAEVSLGQREGDVRFLQAELIEKDKHMATQNTAHNEVVIRLQHQIELLTEDIKRLQNSESDLNEIVNRLREELRKRSSLIKSKEAQVEDAIEIERIIKNKMPGWTGKVLFNESDQESYTIQITQKNVERKRILTFPHYMFDCLKRGVFTEEDQSSSAFEKGGRLSQHQRGSKVLHSGERGADLKLLLALTAPTFSKSVSSYTPVFLKTEIMHDMKVERSSEQVIDMADLLIAGQETASTEINKILTELRQVRKVQINEDIYVQGQKDWVTGITAVSRLDKSNKTVETIFLAEDGPTQTRVFVNGLDKQTESFLFDKLTDSLVPAKLNTKDSLSVNTLSSPTVPINFEAMRTHLVSLKEGFRKIVLSNKRYIVCLINKSGLEVERVDGSMHSNSLLAVKPLLSDHQNKIPLSVLDWIDNSADEEMNSYIHLIMFEDRALTENSIFVRVRSEGGNRVLERFNHIEPSPSAPKICVVTERLTILAHENGWRVKKEIDNGRGSVEISTIEIETWQTVYKKLSGSMSSPSPKTVNIWSGPTPTPTTVSCLGVFASPPLLRRITATHRGGVFLLKEQLSSTCVDRYVKTSELLWSRVGRWRENSGYPTLSIEKHSHGDIIEEDNKKHTLVRLDKDQHISTIHGSLFDVDKVVTRRTIEVQGTQTIEEIFHSKIEGKISAVEKEIRFGSKSEIFRPESSPLLTMVGGLAIFSNFHSDFSCLSGTQLIAIRLEKGEVVSEKLERRSTQDSTWTVKERVRLTCPTPLALESANLTLDKLVEDHVESMVYKLSKDRGVDMGNVCAQLVYISKKQGNLGLSNLSIPDDVRGRVFLEQEQIYILNFDGTVLEKISNGKRRQRIKIVNNCEVQDTLEVVSNSRLHSGQNVKIMATVGVEGEGLGSLVIKPLDLMIAELLFAIPRESYKSLLYSEKDNCLWAFDALPGESAQIATMKVEALEPSLFSVQSYVNDTAHISIYRRAEGVLQLIEETITTEKPDRRSISKLYALIKGLLIRPQHVADLNTLVIVRDENNIMRTRITKMANYDSLMMDVKEQLHRDAKGHWVRLCPQGSDLLVDSLDYDSQVGKTRLLKREIYSRGPDNSTRGFEQTDYRDPLVTLKQFVMKRFNKGIKVITTTHRGYRIDVMQPITLPNQPSEMKDLSSDNTTLERIGRVTIDLALQRFSLILKKETHSTVIIESKESSGQVKVKKGSLTTDGLFVPLEEPSDYVEPTDWTETIISLHDLDKLLKKFGDLESNGHFLEKMG